MLRRKKARSWFAPAALAWGLLAFAAGQWLLHQGAPKRRDPEYSLRLERLRARLDERANTQPRILFLGSSRVAVGVWPELFAEATRAAPGKPVLFNFALCSAGPVLELLCLNRLLADGIRPDWVVLEVWPPLLRLQGTDHLDVSRLAQHDVRFLERYDDRHEVLAGWGVRRLVPAYWNRLDLAARFAPEWTGSTSRESFLREINWQGLDDWGWLRVTYYQDRPETDLYSTHKRDLAANCCPILRDCRVSPASRRALGDLLALCRRQGIGILLLWMPEESDFQNWYSAAAQRRMAEYLAAVCREHAVRLIDARNWATDEEFADGVHLSWGGAIRFTRRLGSEVLQPLLAGQLPACAAVPDASQWSKPVQARSPSLPGAAGGSAAASAWNSPG
jgi:hypothetical protein